MKLTVPRTTRSCWASLQQGVDFAKLDLSVLSVPYSKRQAGIDAILSPCTFLQVRLFIHKVVHIYSYSVYMKGIFLDFNGGDVARMN